MLIPDVENQPQCRSLWKKVVNLVLAVQNIAQFTVKNDKGIRFWKDKWLNRGYLKYLFPVVFKAAKEKDATIADMIQDNM